MSDLLTALSVVFVLGAAFLIVANHLDLPTVPFFILAGLVAGLFIDEDTTLELARYGIAFLVFTFGARIQFDTVRTVLGDSEIVALGQFLVTGGLGLSAGILLGIPPEQAIYLGIATALSSTIVGTGLLEPEIRKNLVHGRLAESIHFVQDLLAILLVLVLSAETFAADPIAMKVGYGVMLLIAGVLVNRFGFDIIATLSEGSDELLLVGTIALLIGFLAVAELVGVSIVVGAFAAGLAIRRDPTEHLGMLNGLESIKDFFVAVFFVTLGALVTVPTLEVVVIATVLGVLTAIVKPVITAALLIYEGYEARSATLTSLSLDQVSEFTLIIAIEALLIGLLVQSLFDAIILAAAVTMITSSFSRRYDERIYRLFADRGLIGNPHEKIDERSSVPDDLSDHVVIVGYGRQGRRLADTCADINQPHVVIENDPAMLDLLESTCESYVFGDAMEEYTWEKSNVDDARLIVSTVDDERLSRRLLVLSEDTDVVLRSADPTLAVEFIENGALYVNVPDMLASERLIEHVRSVGSGDLSPEELREQHLEELAKLEGTTYHTMADEIDALR